MSKRNLYLKTIQTIRRERGEHCEACGIPATHGHHVIPVSETSICSALVFEPANILILCDDCHALMHAHNAIRNITDTWKDARIRRGQALNG
jgi:5-methylcytosine-specific restriction endonuclease McrA